MENVKKNLNFEECCVIDSVGKSRGLTLLWKNWIRILQIEVSNFYITAHILDVEENCK